VSGVQQQLIGVLGRLERGDKKNGAEAGPESFICMVEVLERL
jgi:hypothetical protein